MNRAQIIVLMAVLDAVVFGGWVAKEYSGRNTTLIKLPINGYDPRDLLSGHYVRFQLRAEVEANSFSETGSEFCIAPTDDRWHITHERLPNESCQFIRRDLDLPIGSRFGVDRFYVDERLANAVTRVNAGPETYLLAAVTADGRVNAVQLVVDGNPIGQTEAK